MSTTWATVLVVGAGTVALKAAGPVGVSGRRLPARVTELLEVVAPAILAALVVTEINPDHDPEGLLVRQFIDAFADALRPVAANAARR